MPGDILGHEFMGEVVEVGEGNPKLKVGQRVVVPFTISCGKCFFCEHQQYLGVRQLQSRPTRPTCPRSCMATR